MITPRRFCRTIGFVVAVLMNTGSPLAAESRQPNIVYIYADDLGYGELGCYGQTKIKTPSLDRLAATGLRFTQHYSGSAVCAPSRCVVLTGLHTGHAYIRGNDEMQSRGDVWNDPTLEGQRPLPAGTGTVAKYLQRRGYATACIGKWGSGGPASTGHPNRQGFDLFFGYLCQRMAHNYYPTHLWRNADKVLLENRRFPVHSRFPADADPHDPSAYDVYRGPDYAVEHMTDEALKFVRANRVQPFFLWLTYPLPHVALQVPESALDVYRDAFPEQPYLGDKGYSPHQTPRAAYAAMITLMDNHIGRLLKQLDDLGIREETLVIFSSDNGPTYAGGVELEFFNSTTGLRGRKGNLYEGGIRVPMIANWPGTIKASQVSDHLSAQWDMFATVTDLLGDPPDAAQDGISFLPTLTGNGTQRQHDYLYWEHNGWRAVRRRDWKGVKNGLRKNPAAALELYDLRSDPCEETNVATSHPQIAEELEELMQQRTLAEFEEWNF